MLTVDSVELRNFRGVSGPWLVPLGATGSPTATLIFGENGAGKSSVVDAVEFAAQALMGGASPRSRLAPSARFLLAGRGEDAWVELTLSDGQKLRRHVNGNELSPRTSKAAGQFERARLVLRRRDVEAVISVQDNERRTRIVSFLQMVSRWVAGDDGADAATARQRLALQASALDAAQEALRDAEERGLTADTIAKLRLRVESATGRVSNERHELKKALSRQALDNLDSLLADASSRVTEGFQRIFPHAQHIRRVKYFMDPATDRPGRTDVDFGVELSNGDVVPPAKVLSEAMLDALGFLALAHLVEAVVVRYGEPRVLILDDVFQSVDSVVRHRLAMHVFQAFPDWQLVLTFHDRSWFEEFARQAANARVSRKVLAIEAGPAGSPRLVAMHDNRAEELRAMLTGSPIDPSTLAGKTGVLLEELCDDLSFTFEISVPRKREQKYTLGDLWPKVSSKLRERPASQALVDDVQQLVHLRNLGAHASPTSASVTTVEASDFARAVLRLWDSLFCQACRRLPERARPTWRCECGGVTLEPRAT